MSVLLDWKKGRRLSRDKTWRDIASWWQDFRVGLSLKLVEQLLVVSVAATIGNFFHARNHQIPAIAWVPTVACFVLVYIVGRTMAQTRQALDLARQASSRDAMLVKASPLPILQGRFDREKDLLIINGWNDAAAQLFGYEDWEVLGMPLRTLFAPEAVHALDALVYAAQKGLPGKQLRASLHIKKRDGQQYLIEQYLSRWEDGGGEWWTAIVVPVDGTTVSSRLEGTMVEARAWSYNERRLDVKE